MKQVKFNDYYALKPDQGKVLILSSFPGRNMIEGMDDSFTYIIHPIYAMILSYIDNRDYTACIKDAASDLDVSEDLIRGFIDKLIDNPETVMIKNKEGVSAFPPYTIVSSIEGVHNRRYNSSIFSYKYIDLRMTRHHTPSTLTFMVNNICLTDCVYCYQDKSRKVGCGVELERMKELIHEANSLHVNAIDVIGGEFFLYPHWKELLTELRKYGYNPYLSTKLPLSEEDIKFLHSIKVHDIQISLDSLIDTHLQASLKVKEGYAQNMIDCLRLLDKYGITTMIHSVLTQYNDSVEDMASVYSQLYKLNNIKDWLVVKGDESLYPRTPYSEIEISDEKLDMIIDYLSDLEKESRFSIRYPEKRHPATTEVSTRHEETEGDLLKRNVERFFSRSFCSGLFSSLYILPDGKVTMCEQLYWNKDFIIGDVLSQSLEEIWNSEKACSLFFIKQESIPEDSLCHSCQYFNECRSIRQICYREVIRDNGASKWYYPDPNCPFVGQELSLIRL
ncbi:MAG: radical SAM protein [Bacteroides sp.]|nr:radical SAM protein [Bacteroides sp.]